MRFLLPVFLILPVVALDQTGIDRPWALGYVLLINLVTYVAYLWDKRQARNDGWRVSEFRLHALEILGGWPAAWIAQRRLRHKCAKRRYQVVFWLIILVYQLVALDLIFKGKLYQLLNG